MSKRIFVLMGALVVAIAAIAAGQTSRSAAVPKTPWGDPDLQGPWTSDDTWGVPFERAASFGTRATLTEDELAARAKQVEASKQRIEHPSDDQHSPAKRQLDAELSGQPAPAPAPGGRGGGRGPSVDAAPVPGQFGEYARRASKQTSQVIDPPNGRIPELTAEGKARQAAMRGRGRGGGSPDSWEDWSIYDRCITRGVAGSIIPVIYGNGLEIVQAPGYVAIRYEMVHDTRIIPLDGRAHLSKDVHTYMGDPVGHWEGNTLVVETTNLNDKMGVGPNGGGLPYSEDTVLTERFLRACRATSSTYELTVNDPKTYTAPWKVAFPITQEPGYKVFEYACHEGNMSLRNALLANRSDKEKAEAAAKK